MFRRDVLRRPIVLALSKDSTGETIGQRCLADPFGTNQQPRMVQTRALQRVLELCDSRVVAEDTIDLSRRGKWMEAVGLHGGAARTLGGEAHGSRLMDRGSWIETHGFSRWRTASQTSSATMASVSYTHLTLPTIYSV